MAFGALAGLCEGWASPGWPVTVTNQERPVRSRGRAKGPGQGAGQLDREREIGRELTSEADVAAELDPVECGLHVFPAASQPQEQR